MSTEQANKRIADNRLIAEFMGCYLNDSGTAYYMKVGDPFAIGGTRSVYPFGLLKYHTSWDWLMPVVEKIQQLRFMVAIIGDGNPNTNELPNNYCNIFKEGFTLDMVIDGGLIKSNSKIDAVYQAVLQFIQWHNQNKTV
jgi:hypothetical protein